MKLTNELNSLKKYPFHMPGHKRNSDLGIIGAGIDITEIEGFDNLHDASGVLLDVENELSSIYKSKKSFMLVNGSTVGLLSAIYALCNENDKIIISRNCHKSVYNACMLLKLRVVYVEPEFDYQNGYYSRVTQHDVDEAIIANPDASCIVITSPTYEGNISNINSKIPLIIDAAHGAHLGLASFPSYPRADIVISSLHKTLPALTQTAVLNVYNDKYLAKVKRFVDVFETSSPSYVLMNSVAICCDFIKNNADKFKEYYNNVYTFRDLELNALDIRFADDLSKIVVSTANTDLSGAELANILRKKYCIEPEMASLNYIILMTSVADTIDALNHLKNALIEIDGELFQTTNKLMKKPPIPRGEQVVMIDDESNECPLENAAGKLSNEFVYAYPPDIPIIVPNEVISQNTIDYIKTMIDSGVNVVSDSGLLPNKLLTK